MTDQANTINNITPTPEDELTYCAVHPDRETGLRCNKCERYMCAECAVSTPIGYRCKQCVRQVDDTFYNVAQSDYVVLFAVCAGLSIVGGFLAGLIGFILFTFFLGMISGGIIAEVSRRFVKGKRGRYNAHAAVGGVVLGGFVGGAAQAVLNYNGTWGEFVDAFRALGRSLPPEIPTMTEFVIQSTVTDIAFLVFIGAVAAAVYSRYRI